MMRYYRKEHTIKLCLTNLFPRPVDDSPLSKEIRDYYQSKGMDYAALTARQEADNAAQFQRYKALLLGYAPEELKPLIEHDQIFPTKGLPPEIVSRFEHWSRVIFKEVEQAFKAYDEYISRVRHLLPAGFQEMLEMYLHDSSIIDWYMDKTVLKMEICDIHNKRYKLEFSGTKKVDYHMDMKENIWKQDELFVREDGDIELSILTDEAGDQPVIESINEIRVVASDVIIMKTDDE